MLTRMAVFEGKINVGREKAFFDFVEERLVPLWRRFPHARNVRVLKAIKSDDGAPPVAMTLAIDFPSLEAIDEALASDVRTQARAATADLVKMFEGRIYHIVHEQIGAA